jgi:creatinine amidohydrolase/Fe(II)-dependent formamide hydrolase-like protein
MERRKFILSAVTAAATLPAISAMGNGTAEFENIEKETDLNLTQPENYHPPIDTYPADTVNLPARLENMRPGQVRFSAGLNTLCLIPVGKLNGYSDKQSVGFPEAFVDSLIEMTSDKKVVIAPAIWYTPNSNIQDSPSSGAFDISMDAFTLYLEDVMTNIVNLGFKRVQIVILNDHQGKNSPLYACARFVVANQYNNLWKRPEFGKNWYINPELDDATDEHGVIDKRGEIFSRYSVKILNSPISNNDSKSQSAIKPIRLENMTSAQIKDAVNRNLICFVPSGVLETHGNHNPIGVDGIESEGPALLACAKADAIVAPTIWYGPTEMCCGDETVGNTNIDGNNYRNYISGVINGLAAIGFKKIVVIQVHQGPDGPQWVSTDYAIQDYRVNFYKKRSSKTEIPADVTVMSPPFGQYDHAGKNETSWMMYFRPEYTDLSLIRPNDYFYCWQKGGESNKATYEWGEKMAEKTVNGLVEMINQHNLK